MCITDTCVYITCPQWDGIVSFCGDVRICLSNVLVIVWTFFHVVEMCASDHICQVWAVNH